MSETSILRGGPIDPQVIDLQGTGAILRCSTTTRRYLPPRMKTVAGILALFVAGSLTGCISTPAQVVPASIVGRWVGVESGAVLEFTPVGIFVVEMTDVPTIIGRSSFVGSRATLRYQLGSAICPEEPGQYTFEINGPNMRTADPADTCVSRRVMMAQAWTREAK